MTAHTWEVETVNGGPCGDMDAYICRVCEASGGPVGGFLVETTDIPSMRPFLAGTGIKLGDDCDEAKRLVSVFRTQEVAAKGVLAAYKDKKMTRIECALRLASEFPWAAVASLRLEKKLQKRYYEIRSAMSGGMTLTVGTGPESDEDDL